MGRVIRITAGAAGVSRLAALYGLGLEQRAAEGIAAKVAGSGNWKLGEASAQNLDGHPLGQLIVGQCLQCRALCCTKAWCCPVMREPPLRRAEMVSRSAMRPHRQRNRP
jgi:hypothetical protein